MRPRLTLRLTSLTATKPRNSLVRPRVSRMFSSAMRCAPALPVAELFSAPARLALGDERIDAFGGVLEHHVAGHALGGERIGVHEPLFHLLVEEALAHAHHGAAVREDLAGELVDLGIELGERRDAVYQAPGERGPRVDRIAGKEHFQRVFAREIPRDADSRRGTEDAALDSRKRELGDLARHGEIAHRHE